MSIDEGHFPAIAVIATLPDVVPSVLIHRPCRAVANSGENLFLVAFILAPSHKWEPPENPGRFRY